MTRQTKRDMAWAMLTLMLCFVTYCLSMIASGVWR